MEEEVMEQDHEEIMDVTLTTETPPPDTEDLDHLLEGPGQWHLLLSDLDHLDLSDDEQIANLALSTNTEH